MNQTARLLFAFVSNPDFSFLETVSGFPLSAAGAEHSLCPYKETLPYPAVRHSMKAPLHSSSVTVMSLSSTAQSADLAWH